MQQRLARRANYRWQGQQGELPGFNAAESLAQVLRMRLFICFQWSQAHAMETIFPNCYSNARRVSCAASGSRWGASFPAASYSDLMLLTRGY
eukprot:SM000228S07375  [mRNA]  locus=s228:20284:20569:+ [translate_table: standard]